MLKCVNMPGILELCSVMALVRCKQSGRNLRFRMKVMVRHLNDSDDRFFRDHYNFPDKLFLIQLFFQKKVVNMTDMNLSESCLFRYGNPKLNSINHVFLSE